MNSVIIIPARMASARLPGKPLADIGGIPMILRVAMQAARADVGPVMIATDTAEIAQLAREAGFDAVMTGDHHQSGSDRIFEALQSTDPDGSFDNVINLQGDLPLINPDDIRKVLEPLSATGPDISTLGCEIVDDDEKTDPNVVKIVGSPVGNDLLNALYFTRATAPWGDGPLYHHIGIYAYRRAALARFVSLPASPLEQRERLEQLRALEAGMKIRARIIGSVPVSVDTPADLEKARKMLAASEGH